MVVATSATATTPSRKTTPLDSNPMRTPLLPAEKDNLRLNNINNNNVPNQRRPKSREVMSRYLSTSSSSSTSNSSSNSSATFSSRRCPSPMPSTPRPSTPGLSRAQSVERRRSIVPREMSSIPCTPRPSTPAAMHPQSEDRRRAVAGLRNPGEMSAAAKLLVSSASLSSRSLSVSFQGESYALPRGRAVKPAATPSPRGPTPERRRNVGTPRRVEGGENVRGMEQQPWPARVVSVSQSVDFGGRALQESSISNNCRPSSDATLRKSVSVGTETFVSDAESVSSEGNSGSPNSNVRNKGGGGRSVVVPPRYSQDLNSRLKRGGGVEPGSPLARVNSSKLITPRKFVSESPVGSPRGSGSVSNRGSSSLLPGGGTVRPASPSKLALERSLARAASPLRGRNTVVGSLPSGGGLSRAASPTRSWNSGVGSLPLGGGLGRAASPSRGRSTFAGSMPSGGGLSRAASPSRGRNSGVSTGPCVGEDVRRLRVGDSRLGDPHLLRLLHNRELQWRFANVRAVALMSNQQMNAERSLYNAWKTTSDLREAVSVKRKELQWMKLKLKLVSILKGQMAFLEEWAALDKGHCSTLSGAIDSLEATITRLPLVGGTRADIRDLKEAMGSATDVMLSMASSTCSLLQKVEEVNSLVVEVASLISKEHSFLKECKDTLSALTAMQVKDCSLRTHVLQLKSAPSSVAVV